MDVNPDQEDFGQINRNRLWSAPLLCSSSSFPGKNPLSLSMSIFSSDVSLFCSLSELSSLSDNNVDGKVVCCFAR